MKSLKKQFDIGYAVLMESDIKAGHFETTYQEPIQLLIFVHKKEAENNIKTAKYLDINQGKEIVRKVKISLY